jgi:tetratricopeptide (TPR) repeat protein
LWIFSICQLVAVVALMAAVFQYYLFPDWMVTMDRERNPAYMHGAAGLLMDPSSLASLLMMFWPVSVLIVWARRFSGPVRILNGFFAIAFFMGILVSTDRPGLFVLAGVLAFLPIFMSKFWPIRRKLWLYGTLAGLVCLPLFWFGTDTLQSRMVYFMASHSDAIGSASIHSAWQLFLENPLFGKGMGSFGYLWESLRPEGLQGTSVYSLSSYAGLLAELGVLGLGLLGLPVIFLLFRGIMFWKAIPYLTIDKDTQSRMARYPKNHPNRFKLERANGRTPSAKVILGGLVLGFFAFLFYIGWDYSVNLPIHLFLFASLLAALAAVSRGGRRTTVSSYAGIATGLIPVLLSSWALAFGSPKFYSQYSVYTGDEVLAYRLSEPDRIFVEPQSLSPVLESYKLATELSPANAEAWLGLGRAQLARIYADVWPSEELAGEAKLALEEALSLAPDNWLAHYELARSLAILGDASARINEHLRRAISLAPARPEPPAFLGSLMLFRDRASAEGLQLLNEGMRLDPGYEPAVKFFRRMGAASGDMQSAGGGTTQAGAMSESLLAESFTLDNPGPERILGAGVMPDVEEAIPVPE